MLAEVRDRVHILWVTVSQLVNDNAVCNFITTLINWRRLILVFKCIAQLRIMIDNNGIARNDVGPMPVQAHGGIVEMVVSTHMNATQLHVPALQYQLHSTKIIAPEASPNAKILN